MAIMTPRDGPVQCHRSDRREVLTGSDLKDLETAKTLPQHLYELPADLGAIERALGWE